MCSVDSSLRPQVSSSDHSRDPQQLSRRRGRRQGRARHRRRRCGATRLMYAAQQGDVDRVRSILRSQPSTLFDRDRTGKSALHYCCSSDNIRAAHAADLLAMAAPDLVDSRDEDGFTPLHLAVIAGNTQLVTFLLANGADVSAVDNEQHTVVHWATVCGETASLRAVLAAGAPVSTPDVHGGYPLHYAAQMCGGEKDFNLGLQVLQILLNHKDINVSVEDGDKRQPLLWAASAGSSKALLALVRAGAKVESYDKDGLTALHCAASRGHTDCIDTLLTLCGASPDVIDSNGCTALHYAVTLGHADATSLLLSHGADTNRQDRKGRTPAHCGCAKGQFETLKLLASRGANLWLRNARGDLPLHEAAASGRRELVSWLLNMRPSQVNAKNNDGRTPLHMAAMNDNTDMCKILLDSGAHINPILRTSKNVFMTPLDCALQRGFRSTAKFLQLHGGLPATRLGSQSSDTRKSSSVISFPIREDMTFDTSSESADEQTEPTKSISSKTFVRRKSKSKAKTKVTVSGNESDVRKSISGKSQKSITMADQKTQTTFSIEERDNASRGSSRKPTSSKIDYTNEIIINGKTEVTIHQEKEITMDQEGNVLISPRVYIDETITIPARSSSAERPKSAKYSKKSATSNSSKTSKASTPEKKISRTISFEESQIKTDERPLKSALKQSANKPLNDPKQDMTGKDTTELSTTSEDQEESKDIIVEAAVHTQPKDSLEAEDAPQENVGESMNKEDIGHTKETKRENGVDLEKKGKELENTEETDKNEQTEEVLKNQETKEIIEEPKFEKIPPDQQKPAVEQATPDRVDQPTRIETEVEKLSSEDTTLKQDENEQKQMLGDDSLFSEESKIDGIKLDAETVSNLDIQELRTAHDEIDVKPGSSEGIKLEQDSEVQQKITETEGNDHIESKNLEAVTATTVQKTEKIKHEIVLKTSKDEPSKSDGIDLIDSSARLTDTSDKGSEDISPKTKGKDVLAKSRDKNKEKLLKREIPKKGKAKIKESSKPTKVDKPKTKQEKVTSSEDEATFVSPTDMSDSLTEDRIHRSFKVLSEKEVGTISKSKTKDTKKSSRSLPRSKERVLEAKVKRSKIPTPTFATPLSKSDRHLDKIGDRIESRVPSLPNINGELSAKEFHNRPDTNMSAPNLPVAVYSDGERGTDSERDNEKEIASPTRRKKYKRKSRLRHRESRSAGSDYESSNVIDSGFEPSPRSTRIPKWRNMSDRGVVMTSVTRSIQSNIRRYHLERKIFQHLLELKRSQIRVDQHNEQVLVKRAIDQYNQSCPSTVGAGRYIPKDFTFKSFEKFLYESLRKLQKMDLAYLKGLPANSENVNPLLCTQSTHRCMHATHAYTGIPCAAYLPKMDHHNIPKIGFTDTSCKPGTAGFLPKINGKKTVTLELSHGTDKQVISLPTDRLDQNKRYYVTFTVKGHDAEPSVENFRENGHTHAKSD